MTIMALYLRQNSTFAFDVKFTFYLCFPRFNIIALQCDIDVSRCNIRVPQCDIEVSRCNIKVSQCNIEICANMRYCSFYARFILLSTVRIDTPKRSAIMGILNPSLRRKANCSSFISKAVLPRRWLWTWGAKSTVSSSTNLDCASRVSSLQTSPRRRMISSVCWWLSRLTNVRIR